MSTQELPAWSAGALVAEANAIWWDSHLSLRWRTIDLYDPPPDPEIAGSLKVLIMAREVPRGAGPATLTVGELVQTEGAPPLAVASITGARRIVEEARRFQLLDRPHDVEHRLGLVLGRAVAHEIGHYLLRTKTHAPRGLLHFDFAPFAVVGLGVSNETSSILSVAHDHFNGMKLAIEQCAAAGRQRIGVCLTIPANERVREKWLAALALTTRPNGGLARLPAWEGAADGPAFGKWLKAHQPDVLIGTFDRKLLPSIRSLGQRVPEDIAMVALSVTEDERFYAGVDQRSEIIGSRAVDLLVAALNHNESGLLPMHQVLHIEGAWRPARSLPVG